MLNVLDLQDLFCPCQILHSPLGLSKLKDFY